MADNRSGDSANSSNALQPNERRRIADTRLESQLAGAADLELLRRIADKDESALVELMGAYQNRVLNLAYRYLGSREDAEQVAQDVFIKAWNYAQSFRGNAQVWTWLYRITINLCLNIKARKQLPLGTIDESIPAQSREEPAERHTQEELKQQVARALDALQPEQRMAIVLAHFEGLSYKEIAQVMNKPLQTVATILFRARAKLRKHLTEHKNRKAVSNPIVTAEGAEETGE